MVHPVLLRARPDLGPRDKLFSLAHGSDPDEIDLWPVSYGCAIDRRAAPRTECKLEFVSALPRPDIDRRLSGQTKRVLSDRDERAKRGPRQLLAVDAVADFGLFRVRFALVGDVAAVAPAVDMHEASPDALPGRVWRWILPHSRGPRAPLPTESAVDDRLGPQPMFAARPFSGHNWITSLVAASALSRRS